jgi:hypothetical protein
MIKFLRETSRDKECMSAYMPISGGFSVVYGGEIREPAEWVPARKK